MLAIQEIPVLSARVAVQLFTLSILLIQHRVAGVEPVAITSGARINSFQDMELTMRTNTCLKCKAENRLNASHCWNCGAKLKGQVGKYLLLFIVIPIILGYLSTN